VKLPSEIVGAGVRLLPQRGGHAHKCDRFGISRRGSYISVDTGKFSIPPSLARRIAEELAD